MSGVIVSVYFNEIVKVCLVLHAAEEIPASKLKNYYKSVAEHKDITKLLMVLTSVISSTKAEVMTCLDSFTQFHHVWDEDKEKTVAVSTRLHQGRSKTNHSCIKVIDCHICA